MFNARKLISNIRPLQNSVWNKLSNGLLKFPPMRRSAFSSNPSAITSSAVIGQQEFADIFINLPVFKSIRKSQDSFLGVAVSAGPDSFALVHLLHEFCQNSSNGLTKNKELVVFSINHGLRSESLDEIKLVENFCEAKEIKFVALKLNWVNDNPFANAQEQLDAINNLQTSKIMETARKKRYILLSSACRKLGIRNLFVGHHANDDIETFISRLYRSSNLNGLAGMETCRNAAAYPDIIITRPLLGLSKQRLISTVNAAGIKFANDPSNENLKYERAKLRKGLSCLEKKHGLESIELSHLVQRVKAIKQLTTKLYSSLSKECLSLFSVHGYYSLELKTFVEFAKAGHSNRTVALKLLKDIVQSVSGSDYPIKGSSITNVFNSINKHAENNNTFNSMSVGHTIIEFVPAIVNGLDAKDSIRGKDRLTFAPSRIIRMKRLNSTPTYITYNEPLHWKGRSWITIRPSNRGYIRENQQSGDSIDNGSWFRIRTLTHRKLNSILSKNYRLKYFIKQFTIPRTILENLAVICLPSEVSDHDWNNAMQDNHSDIVGIVGLNNFVFDVDASLPRILSTLEFAPLVEIPRKYLQNVIVKEAGVRPVAKASGYKKNANSSTTDRRHNRKKQGEDASWKSKMKSTFTKNFFRTPDEK